MSRTLQMMSDFKKILIVRFSSAGDIVLASTLIRAVRTRFPQSQIDFVTRGEYAELVRSNQNLNYTYAFDAGSGFAGLRDLKRKIAGEGYDLILDIHNSLRSRFLRGIRGVRTRVVEKRIVERTALVRWKKNFYKDITSVADRYIEPVEEFGVTNDGKGLELNIPDETLFAVNGRAAAWNLRRFEKVFALCPGARHFTKRWPADRYLQLGSQLAKDSDAALLLLGGEADRHENALIAGGIGDRSGKERVRDLTGQLSWLETAAALEYADVVITNDSALMHIACARRRPVVALFGSTVKEFGFFPVGPDATALEVPGLPCRPCSHIGRSSCPEGHFRCLNDISVARVLEAVHQRAA